MRLLGRDGISGLNLCAVAVEAGVSLGLVNYHYHYLASDDQRLVDERLHRFAECRSTCDEDATRPIRTALTRLHARLGEPHIDRCRVAAATEEALQVLMVAVRGRHDAGLDVGVVETLTCGTALFEGYLYVVLRPYGLGMR